MRISDWSSDVCSSDLSRLVRIRYPLQAPIPLNSSRRLSSRYLSIKIEKILCRRLVDLRLFHQSAQSIKKPFGRSRKAIQTSHKIGRASCRERVCKYV